jgi:hypothetical protein
VWAPPGGFNPGGGPGGGPASTAGAKGSMRLTSIKAIKRRRFTVLEINVFIDNSFRGIGIILD